MALSTHLRSNVLLPLRPGDFGTDEVFTDVATPIKLPLWHCPFRGCSICDRELSPSVNHEKSWWQHVWHDSNHHKELTRCLQEYSLASTSDCVQEIAFALVLEAMATRERELVPLLGHATDRRTLIHMGEVFQDSRVNTLMCFVCGCKHLQLSGYDKFGAPQEKGDIVVRSNDDDTLHQLLHGNGDKQGYSQQSWKYNFSWKRYRTTFGEAVRTDPCLREGQWEWKRKVERSGGGAKDDLEWNLHSQNLSTYTLI